MFDDEEFIESMRHLAETHQGPDNIRIPPNVLLRLANLASRPKLGAPNGGGGGGFTSRGDISGGGKSLVRPWPQG
jgi:hypothetical protein